ncbi:hypothetical protein JOE61_000924 [Nocardioides salarius]|uniref:Uncharacterized protein n=1 Tax=Nocardioides salarius TaxID=374513 RepID=A0ABS2M7I1_9ACTN|nr:hypothetical protein [Nocardioides salarius]MBM7507110.1 hypothetical protein [Nocardioides salarius]
MAAHLTQEDHGLVVDQVETTYRRTLDYADDEIVEEVTGPGEPFDDTEETRS